MVSKKDVMEATYSLPEAPASVTVKVWIDDYSVMLTMRAQKVGDVVEQLEYIIGVAKKKGWKSVWDSAEQNTGQPTASAPRKTAPPDPDAPTCSVHNRAMKRMKSQYGEFYKCTAKVGDGWCNEKVNI